MLLMACWPNKTFKRDTIIVFKKRDQACSGEMSTPAVLVISREGIGGSIPSTAKRDMSPGLSTSQFEESC